MSTAISRCSTSELAGDGRTIAGGIFGPLVRWWVVLGLLGALRLSAAALTPVHVWEKQELTFTAERTYANTYTDVIVWVDLVGPGFSKRVYGFWDGGQTFHLRVLAT